MTNLKRTSNKFVRYASQARTTCQRNGKYWVSLFVLDSRCFSSKLRRKKENILKKRELFISKAVIQRHSGKYVFSQFSKVYVSTLPFHEVIILSFQMGGKYFCDQSLFPVEFSINLP